MTRCQRCGVESPLEAAFYRADAAGQTMAFVCPPCWSRRSAVRLGSCVGGVVALVILGALAVGRWMPEYLPLFGLILPTAVLYMAAVLAHELGHVVPAVLLGLRVFRVSLGRYGPPVFATRLFNCTFEVRLIPYGGSTQLWPRNTRRVREKMIISTLCGPLVTLTLALVSLGFAVSAQRRGEPAVSSFLFAAINAVLFVQVAIPRKVKIDSGQTSSDFLLAWEMRSVPDDEIEEWLSQRNIWESADCRDRADYTGAKRWALQGLEAQPDNPQCLVQLGCVEFELGNFGAARALFVKGIEQFPDDSLVRPYALQAIVWCDLHSKATDLADAERYASEAAAAMPWVAEFQHARDCVITAIKEGEQHPQ